MALLKTLLIVKVPLTPIDEPQYFCKYIPFLNIFKLMFVHTVFPIQVKCFKMPESNSIAVKFLKSIGLFLLSEYLGFIIQPPRVLLLQRVFVYRGTGLLSFLASGLWRNAIAQHTVAFLQSFLAPRLWRTTGIRSFYVVGLRHPASYFSSLFFKR